MGAPTQRQHREHHQAAPTFPYTINVTTPGLLTSPNGRFTADVSLNNSQQPSIQLNLDGQQLCELACDLLTDSKVSANNLRLLHRSTQREHIDAFAYRQSAIDVTYNVATYRLNDLFNLELRLYDEGLAYRFVQTAKKPLTIRDEVAAITPSGNPVTYAPFTTNAKKPEAMAFQNIYTTAPLSQLENQWAFLPLTLDFGSAKLTITEADLEAYPGLFLRPAGNQLSGTFAHYPRKMDYYSHRGMSHVVETEDFIAKTSGPRTFPWRVLCVTTDDRQTPTSNLVYALAAPNRIGDTSWIKTGKSAWDWWHDWNLKGVPFRAGINMETYRYYIDFAARFGLQYAILDEGWYDAKEGGILQSIPEIDVQELVNYGRERGVGIILWTVFNVLDEHLEEACAKYAAMGVKGFKVDFLDRDDQTAVEMAYRIAEACARHHLFLDYHGFYKPTGLNRTYPNIINIESVFGMEEVKWNSDHKDMPLYDVTFPFIRGMAGFVDYTPGAMRNATKANFRDVYTQPMSMGTRCHQLAAYVVHDSPLTMLADAATAYEAEPDFTRFLVSIPNNIEETRVIAGKMGEYIVTARRAGNTWWIGGQTNWDARDLTLDLHKALGISGERTLTLYADGPNAEHNAEDYAVSHPTLTDRPLTIHLASGGGFVLKVE
ncbi:MAG: glycoside hydrolase family 97 protein [Bacteroidaceae bacterium]|nr:glycoside hydrolase family 97 protein [Bacteroidaceae bacterium]